MPLRDHFRPPLDRRFSWDLVHGGWPMVISQALNRTLPADFSAGPNVHLGIPIEVDIAAFRQTDFSPGNGNGHHGPISHGGGVATFAPPVPTLDVESTMRTPDEYSVRVFDRKRNRRLVAAIELVSPSNKDRPTHRREFVAKAADLVREGVCVSIVDIVGTAQANLYAELLEAIDAFDPSVGEPPSAISVGTVRLRPGTGQANRLEAWYVPLAFGGPLPTLPVWIAVDYGVSLDLDATYEETCRTLRID
jgi:hypothetical protein